MTMASASSSSSSSLSTRGATRCMHHLYHHRHFTTPSLSLSSPSPSTTSSSSSSSSSSSILLSRTLRRRFIPTKPSSLLITSHARLASSSSLEPLSYSSLPSPSPSSSFSSFKGHPYPLHSSSIDHILYPTTFTTRLSEKDPKDTDKTPLDPNTTDDGNESDSNVTIINDNDPISPSSSSSSSSSASNSSSSSSPPSSSSGASGNNNNNNNNGNEYPQLLAIPLTRRPLFPGFYKSLYIKDPQVILAIQALVDRRQPYVAILLAKDDDSELDMFKSLDEVQRVGVFAQITNVYSAGPDNSALTVVVYPHRRIRASEKKVVDEINRAVEAAKKENGAAATGVEKEEKLNVEEKGEGASSPMGPTIIEDLNPNSKLLRERGYLPINEHLASYPVSLVNVSNQLDQPYNAETTLIKAITSEMLNVLKEISQLNPLLRDQIITFSIQTGGNAFADPARLADFAAAVSSGEPVELQSVLESLVVEERLHKALVVLKKELANAKLQQEITVEGIKKELGMDGDGKDKLVEKFRERVNGMKMPEVVKKVFDEELNKLQHLEPNASEFNRIFAIQHATRVLDEDHYGLQDVKDRILEFIAVGKLRGTVEGRLFVLWGRQVSAKHRLENRFARALGREFFRFSVGGLTDVAEIKGHRRTYVGAMPGKVGAGFEEAPRPEQNSSFLDHYLDIPMDLSKVLFVMTLSGYVAEEKVKIAMRYLDPAARVSAGLEGRGVRVDEGAVEMLIREYCRESGVRNLKKHVEKIYRKAGFEDCEEGGGGWDGEKTDTSDVKTDTSEGATSDVRTATSDVTSEGKAEATENLKEFVGSPVFTSDRMYETTPVGVVMGLAWTQMGGSALYIESVVESAITEHSKPSFHRTGQMGDVMKESATIAYTFAKSFVAKREPENRFFEKASVHMHVPEGATPKDGPSAGTTMATSLISLALNRPILQDVAMTENWRVKEKTIAAKRSGVKRILLPDANRSDWEELPGFVKEGVEVVFVKWFEDVYAAVF
ncbi:Lon protease C-terminal proteolytic domain-containing protein [Chytridium lagenaria]|nr:Lon protease C-terminal proteolytic domain-containing protein [Chytridium lagenaria]